MMVEKNEKRGEEFLLVKRTLKSIRNHLRELKASAPSDDGVLFVALEIILKEIMKCHILSNTSQCENNGAMRIT